MLCVLVACAQKSADERVENLVRTALRDSYGIRADVRCKHADRVCEASGDNKRYTFRYKLDERDHAIGVVSTDDALLMAVKTIEDHTALDLACREKHVELRDGVPAFCPIANTDDALRIVLGDRAREQWFWKRVRAPKAVLEAALARAELANATVTCDPLERDRVACRIVAGDERLDAWVDVDNGFELHRDGAPAVVLPAWLEDGGKRHTLRCRRFAKPDEVVTCEFANGRVDVAVDREGQARVVRVSRRTAAAP